MARHSAVDKSILEAALIGLEQQKSEIEAKTAEIRRRLRGLGSAAVSVKAEAAAAPQARAKRVLSPAARKRIADATRKCWAAYRAAKSGKPAPKKRGRKKGSAKKTAAAEATAGE